MKLLVLTALMTTASAVQLRQNIVPNSAMNIKGAAIVDYVNNLKTTWHAEYNVITNRNLMNVKYTEHPEGITYAETPEITVAIPDSFDSRQHWSNCKSIGKIRDQSKCGACWAFAAAEALTDRICIASNGQHTPELSAEDLLECCGYSCGDGCKGGYPIRAWEYMALTGLVTGGGFYEQTGCKPYSASEPCGTHTVNGVTHNRNCTGQPKPTTPSCSYSCANAAYNTPYEQDKHFAKSSYGVPNSVKAIQTEILTNGPVEASFKVYEDFNHYKGGVYQHLTGLMLGGHAVKIIGWGTDNGTPYWLVANSWNTNWGEQRGFFRIIRGKNECGIENSIVAGLAKLTGGSGSSTTTPSTTTNREATPVPTCYAVLLLTLICLVRT